MERGKKTGFILRQIKKKTKRLIKKEFYTEFFYLNQNRRVIEFLVNEDEKSAIEIFFKEFIPEEFRNFIKIKILNEDEEPINSWYYDDENVVLVISVNWGFKKQEISIDIDMDNFVITVIDDKEKVEKNIDYTMFNDYLISFLTIQARTLSETFQKISKK